MSKIFDRYLPENIIPNLPELPKAETAQDSVGEDTREREEAIRTSPPESALMAVHREDGEVGEVSSPIQKDLFTPIEIEEVFE